MNQVFWDSDTLGAAIGRAALWPASLLYAAGWQAYRAVYDLGLKRPKEPHRPVVCVGNLLVGGGGKSPLTMYLVRMLRETGRSVVVSASGYGSPRSEAATFAPDGPLDPKEWGDEPSMLRWLIPDLPLVVGRRRVLAAELCHARFPDAVLLMDDGFQHLPLRKHVSILLDPARPRNSMCLPAGPYREPRGNRSRADLVIPDRFEVTAAPLTFSSSVGEPVTVTEASVLCALARPRGFIEAVKEAGVCVGSTRLLPDHDPLTAGTLLSDVPVDRPVIVTAKDWVKLRNRADIGTRTFIVAKQTIRVEPEDEFREWLTNKISSVPLVNE